MNCPGCGAPMRLKADQESFKCDYCQRVVLPDKSGDDGVRVLDEPADQECPLCNVSLVRATVAKVPILYCKQCRGMLVAMQAMEELIAASRAGQRGDAPPAAADPEDLQRKINCPSCHHHLDAHFYGGPGHVIIDSCEDCCLIWMDGGALTRIARAADERPAPEASSSEDYDQLQGGIFEGRGPRDDGEEIIDGVVDAFFN